jgi:hypothetical protein
MLHACALGSASLARHVPPAPQHEQASRRANCPTRSGSTCPIAFPSTLRATGFDGRAPQCYRWVTSHCYRSVTSSQGVGTKYSARIVVGNCGVIGKGPRERTARKLFRGYGLRGIGVDAIAEAAGTNKNDDVPPFPVEGTIGGRLFAAGHRQKPRPFGGALSRIIPAIRYPSSAPAARCRRITAWVTVL